MREHLKIKSDFDQLPLDVIVLRPAHPKGIIQISHGMCEHKERYLDFMEYLYHLGYVCLIHDHRGHGQSVLKDEDLGYFYQDGDIGIVEDLHQLTLWIHQQYPDLPLYLFGHSMGSLVVRVYLKKYDKDIQGLIVCGSPSHNKMAGVGIYLAQRYAHKKGDHYRPPLIQRIGFESFNKKFDQATPNSWICSDPKVVEQYNHNPLCHFVFTANGFETLFKLVQKTYSKEDWMLQNPTLPIHFIAGQDDPCIQNEKQFKQAVNHLKEVGYQQVDSQLFANMRHEILNEINHEMVYEHIIKKIKSWA